MIFDEKVVQECFCYMLQTNKRFVGAGTDDTVQVKILGQSQNATDWKILDQFFLNDFEAGSTQEYTVSHEGSPVGVPVMISFRKISSIVYQCCSSYGKKLGRCTYVFNHNYARKMQDNLFTRQWFVKRMIHS